MARPRRTQQDELIDRIASALSTRAQLEPWTLAEIAPAAGLSPAGLIKRFGSRSGILEALSRRWIESIPDAPPHGSAVGDELRVWVTDRFVIGGPHAVAYGLVNLVDDLVDDRLRELLAEGWAKEIRYLAAMLAQLRLQRLLEPMAGAELLFDALHGAMLRRAAGLASTEPSHVLDQLLEVWK